LHERQPLQYLAGWHQDLAVHRQFPNFDSQHHQLHSQIRPGNWADLLLQRQLLQHALGNHHRQIDGSRLLAFFWGEAGLLYFHECCTNQDHERKRIMPPKKAKAKKKSKKTAAKKISQGKKITKGKKPTKGKKINKVKKIDKKKTNGNGVAPAGWCQNFPAHPGDLCQFTPPANATITGIPGVYWPFCGPNGTYLPSPINFLANTQVYIQSDAHDGTYQFVPAPCQQGMTHSVTITG